MATTPRPPDQPDPAANTQRGPEFAPTLAGGNPKPAGVTFPPEAWQLIRDLHLNNTPASADTGFSPSPVAGDTQVASPEQADRAAELSTPAGVAVAGYEILGELGRGGMGVVYKARQVSLNRVVALKMIGTDDRVTRQDVIRFLAEANAVAAVRHPNVVEVYDLGQHAGRPYYTMEFVDGGSLSRLLAGAGRLAPADAATLLAAVARGVHAAHLAGIVHRDLKPGNILLQGARGEGQGASQDEASTLTPRPSPLAPKVTDFGIAKRLDAAPGDALTRTRAVLGTPMYMAPEQAGGRAKFVGPRADVYALGVILYQCLTGDVPFRDTDDTDWSLLRRVTDEPPVPPRSHVPELPRDLDLICLKCLEKDPDDRYPTAEALADDLGRFLAGRPVSVRPVSAAARAWRWVKRHPAPAALIALVAALAIGVPPLVVWNQGEFDKSKAVARAAEKERAAAVALAGVRELFGLHNTARRRAADRPPGWTWENRADLAKAAALAGGEPATTADLRSDAVAALLAADLRPAEPVARNLTAAVLTPSPDGTLLAVGEFKGPNVPPVAGVSLVTARVWLVDPVTGERRRELAFPTNKVGKGGPVQDGARAIAFGPGGRVFVGTRSGFVHRFDPDQPGPKPARSWKAGTEVDRLAVSADGTAVYTAGSDPAVVKWDAATGKELLRAAVHGGIHHALMIDPATGDPIAGDGDELVRFDPKTLKPKTRVGGFPGTTRRVDPAAGGRAAVVVAGTQVLLADPVTFADTARFTDPELRTAAHADAVANVAAHPAGMYLATASDHDRQVKVWELAAGRLVGAVSVPGTDPIAVAWSGDGRFLLATAPGQVMRWEFAAPPAARFAVGNASPPAAAAFTADGKGMLGLALVGHSWRLLLDAGGKPTAVPLPVGPGRGRPAIAVSPTGTVAVGGLGKGIVVGSPPAAFSPPGFTPDEVRCPRFSPDGATLWAVVDSSKIEAWDAATGTTRGSWDNYASRIALGLPALEALAVGPTKTAVGGQDGSVRVFNPQVEPVAAFPHAGDPVQAVAITPDEAFVVAGSRDGRLRVVRLADNTELPPRVAHAGGVVAVAVSRDGTYLATGGKDRTVKVWRRAADGFEWLFAAADLPAPVAGLEFSPTDHRLLVWLTNDHAARVWDVATLRDQLQELGLGW